MGRRKDVPDGFNQVENLAKFESGRAQTNVEIARVRLSSARITSLGSQPSFTYAPLFSLLVCSHMDMLDPSWKRVAAFDGAGPSSLHASDADSMEVDEDGEWEYEDEEELITLDLGPDSKRLVQMSQEYSIAVSRDQQAWCSDHSLHDCNRRASKLKRRSYNSAT
jgi:hypothetical protein